MCELGACLALPDQKVLSGFAVDAAAEAGEDGAGVLGDNQGVAFGELPDLFGSQDEHVVAGGGASTTGTVLPESNRLTPNCNFCPR